MLAWLTFTTERSLHSTNRYARVCNALYPRCTHAFTMVGT